MFDLPIQILLRRWRALWCPHLVEEMRLQTELWKRFSSLFALSFCFWCFGWWKMFWIFFGCISLFFHFQHLFGNLPRSKGSSWMVTSTKSLQPLFWKKSLQQLGHLWQFARYVDLPNRWLKSCWQRGKKSEGIGQRGRGRKSRWWGWWWWGWWWWWWWCWRWRWWWWWWQWQFWWWWSWSWWGGCWWFG